ncbi:hypothetical protein MAE02_33040 [Microvirga aerophila]|uniref:Uncharacterized protein n=1 Tax=Microvirga aerophila TaxID=670291 RepID=A0A512BUF9_9HYPH|nr:hypothetical protein MAE02_33040 [Microvirga aerophila]
MMRRTVGLNLEVTGNDEMEEARTKAGAGVLVNTGWTFIRLAHRVEKWFRLSAPNDAQLIDVRTGRIPKSAIHFCAQPVTALQLGGRRWRPAERQLGCARPRLPLRPLPAARPI